MMLPNQVESASIYTLARIYRVSISNAGQACLYLWGTLPFLLAMATLRASPLIFASGCLPFATLLREKCHRHLFLLVH